jgi:hypothetical protein
MNAATWESLKTKVLIGPISDPLDQRVVCLLTTLFEHREMSREYSSNSYFFSTSSNPILFG